MGTSSAPSASSKSGGGGGTAKSTTKTVTKSSAGTTKAKPRPKKKAATKRPETASAYAASRQAQIDLASQWNNAAKKVTDSLWYRAEDVLPTVTADATAGSESSNKLLPEEVKIVDGALKKNGMTRSDVTPQAFACLLEQARRYAMEILSDSQDYAMLAGRTEIAKADLTLANEMRPDHPIAVTTQLPKLNLLAQTVNRVPLPPIPTQCYSGVLLPPKHRQLTARTFDVVTGAQTVQRMVQAAPTQTIPSTTSSSSKSGKSGTGASSSSALAARDSSSSGGKSKAAGYGASKAKSTININLKGKGDSGGKAKSEADNTTTTSKLATGSSLSSATAKTTTSATGSAFPTGEKKETNDDAGTQKTPATTATAATAPSTSSGDKSSIGMASENPKVSDNKAGPTDMDTSS
mmetsp:Transcript_19600/g.47296  ORF Transcript_19600/g.47296 Transcript_19600/m.47296 type:complete len:407 (+) Transcript_19600:140-1360(+)